MFSLCRISNEPESIAWRRRNVDLNEVFKQKQIENFVKQKNLRQKEKRDETASGNLTSQLFFLMRPFESQCSRCSLILNVIYTSL